MTISGCTDDNSINPAAHRPTMTNIPATEVKVWTVNKYHNYDTFGNGGSGYVRIACNNVLVLDFTVPNNPPNADECEKLGHTSWKTWFLKGSSWNTGTMKYLTAGADYLITVSKSKTISKAGEPVTISCRVFFPRGSAAMFDTVGENPSWALQPDDQMVVDPTTTTTTTVATYDAGTRTSTLALAPGPTSDTSWRCDFMVSKEGGAATKISNIVKVRISYMEMKSVWILEGSDMMVVCVVNHGTAMLTEVSFTWGAETYTTSSATAAGLTMEVCLSLT